MAEPAGEDKPFQPDLFSQVPVALPEPPAEQAAAEREPPAPERPGRIRRHPAPREPQRRDEPIPVGDYARRLKAQLRRMPRAIVEGEIVDLRRTRVQVYFTLRDERGGLPCTMWSADFDRLKLPDGSLRDGSLVIAAGTPDYYEGGARAGPSFSFRVTKLRLAGEGDLLARLAILTRRLEEEGLFEPQKRLPRPALPKTIGVVTAEGGAARQDFLAGLERRGWRGTIVWGFAPVQDRHAAPRIARAASSLAAVPEVEVIVICRGGGSLADLWAFCDEDLCRTVAMLRVPVVTAVGHERDTTLIDHVAAVRCSTPSHAPEAAIPLDVRTARAGAGARAGAVARAAGSAVGARAKRILELSGGPGRAVRAQRQALNQRAREIRASSSRGIERRGSDLALSLRSGLGRPRAALAAETRDLAGKRLALRAHDPQRTLERGYARVEDEAGRPVVTAKEAVARERVVLDFADGRLGARPEGSVDSIEADER